MAKVPTLQLKLKHFQILPFTTKTTTMRPVELVGLEPAIATARLHYGLPFAPPLAAFPIAPPAAFNATPTQCAPAIETGPPDNG
jgi:hypothetical protein